LLGRVEGASPPQPGDTVEFSKALRDGRPVALAVAVVKHAPRGSSVRARSQTWTTRASDPGLPTAVCGNGPSEPPMQSPRGEGRRGLAGTGGGGSSSSNAAALGPGVPASGKIVVVAPRQRKPAPGPGLPEPASVGQIALALADGETVTVPYESGAVKDTKLRYVWPRPRVAAAAAAAAAADRPTERRTTEWSTVRGGGTGSRKVTWSASCCTAIPRRAAPVVRPASAHGSVDATRHLMAPRARARAGGPQ